MVGNARQRRVPVSFFEVFPFYLPTIEEQQTIVAFMLSLDELINARTQKIEALRTHKKGLMQQLFPMLDEVPA
jgi:type I restriction enzyme S subunit